MTTGYIVKHFTITSGGASAGGVRASALAAGSNTITCPAVSDSGKVFSGPIQVTYIYNGIKASAKGVVPNPKPKTN